MEFLLISYSFVFNFSIVYLKRRGFMTRNLQSVVAFIPADLLVLRIKAISPNVWPCVRVFIIFPSI